MKATPFDWQSKAKCSGQSSALFFEDERKGGKKGAYKAICASCPVLYSCLEAGLIYDFDGIWGGLSPQERHEQFPKGYRKQLIEDLEELGDFVKLTSIPTAA